MKFSMDQIYSILLYLFLSGICIFEMGEASGFTPLIQLPTDGLFSNSSTTLIPVVLNIDDFGAKGDGITDDSKSLRDVWKVACSSSWPAKIVIPAQKFYLVRPTNFAGPCRSELTFSVSGFIVAPSDPKSWKGADVHKWLYFHAVDQLKVEGGGMIDGNGRIWWARSCKTNHSNPCTHAPTAMTFHKCKNLKVQNISLINSQQMHMAFNSCKGVAVSGVTVMAPAHSPNTDGIHISASNLVVLDNIIVSTGDDCISIVSHSSQIQIKNAFCGRGHGISIGSLGKYNTHAWVKDVVVDGAFILNAVNGVRIKTWQGGSGSVERVTFRNILMENVSNPILIDQYYCDSPKPCTNQTSAVRIDSVSFIGIRGTSLKEECISIACSDSYPCQRLYLENIQLERSDGTANSKSFCWEAYGASSGVVYPPSCLSSGQIIIRYQMDKSNTSISEQRDELALF